MLLIIVTGLPGTGKTTIARRIAGEFDLPLVAKDEIKERLFDRLGWKDREWSRMVGAASVDLLYYTLERVLSSGGSLVVESNFKPELDGPKILELKRHYRFNVLVIHCRADGGILLQRLRDRVVNGGRHPGHVDDVTWREYEPVFARGDTSRLDVGDVTLDVDTTDFSSVDNKPLLWAVRSMMACSQPPGDIES